MDYKKRSRELRKEALAERRMAEQHMEAASGLEQLATVFENLALSRAGIPLEDVLPGSTESQNSGPLPHALVLSAAEVTQKVLEAKGGSLKLSEVYDTAKALGYNLPWPKRSFEAQLYARKMRSRFHLSNGLLSIAAGTAAPQPSRVPGMKANSIRSFVRKTLLSVQVPTHFSEALKSLKESGEIPEQTTERQFRDAMYSVAKDLRGEGRKIEIKEGVIVPDATNAEPQQRFLP